MYAVKPTECFVLNSLEFLVLMKLGGHRSGKFKVYSFEYEKFVDKLTMWTKSPSNNLPEPPRSHIQNPRTAFENPPTWLDQKTHSTRESFHVILN